MPITAATGDPAARSVEAQFLDLICDDPDLLQAEFDAIIAAEWPEPPGNRFSRGAVGGYPNCRDSGRAADRVAGPAARPRHPGVGGWARQRSPPHCGKHSGDTRGRWSPHVNQPARGGCSPRPHVSPSSV
jgi:hypothetical protein